MTVTEPPSSPSSSSPSSRPSLPPLGHEVMAQQVPGFRRTIEEAARHLRQTGWTDTEVPDPPALLDRTRIGELLRDVGKARLARGYSEDAAIAEMQLLDTHAFYALSYELHRRKTFWVDESLAFMLAHTRLDVRGDGLRLPFPALALVFTDRETLALGEALASRDRDAGIRGLPLRALTVYVTQIPATRGALGMHVALLFDAGLADWPWMITRDLDVGPDDMLDEILASRFPDSANPDPVFMAPELSQLLQLVINAILYATSSPTWDVVASPVRKAERRQARGDARKQAAARARAEALRGTVTGEDVWHLPGKIPISQVRALREVQRRDDGGALFARCMVRGHWRRAPETWADRRPRWIEPYWKGPELGAIVEREYKLQP